MDAHGENQNPISEVAKYCRNLIPANIPELYALNPILKNIADEEQIRIGVIAFRDFLLDLFDRLISHGRQDVKPAKKAGNQNKFLGYISNILVDIGYHGKPSKSGDMLLATNLPSCTASKPAIPVSAQRECLLFLTYCGFYFAGVDFDAKAFKMPEMLEVTYTKSPILLVGLRAMAFADMELRTTRRFKNDNYLLRCDYRLLKAEKTDMLDILKDYMHPLPVKVQELVIKLHKRYIDMGLTCVLTILGDDCIAYANISKNRKKLSPRDIYQERIWAFSYSLKHGYCLFVRAKKTQEYADVIATFPLHLRKKIDKGYGCDRKLHNEPCRGGCQGICLPLDDGILDISSEIEIWLDNEMPKQLHMCSVM